MRLSKPQGCSHLLVIVSSLQTKTPYVLLLCNGWQQRGSLPKWPLKWKCTWRKDVSPKSSMQKKMTPTDMHWPSLKVCRDHGVDGSTVRRWVLRFSSGNSNMRDKPHSRWPLTAVAPWNEEYLNQLICMNQQITTRELCKELNNGFNASEKAMTVLGYHKVCSKWVHQCS